ncbi:MAG: Asp23/Gls24 family envelope stress response protein [Coriobacteriaceae bacterium]|nr:Asp23/Gls24 family envelope stress response protein [Coriobacteriaceae bacterium]
MNTAAAAQALRVLTMAGSRDGRYAMIDPLNETTEITHEVVQTIIALAVKDIKGIVQVGNPPARLLQAVFRSTPSNQGIDLLQDENGDLTVGVHVTVRYGRSLADVSDDIRQAVYDAITTQTSMNVKAVDVYVDGIRFSD